jgi:hypothetical protein
VDLDRILTALVGALFGALGWLVVGLYIQRRQALRQARSAGRAVYFELAANRVVLEVADQHASYAPLARSAYERLLPELAAWLRADELERIARAYMGHAGYRQLETAAAPIPAAVRTALLRRILEEHHGALDVLGQRAFTRSERQRLATGVDRGDAQAQSMNEVGRDRPTEVTRA